MPAKKATSTRSSGSTAPSTTSSAPSRRKSAGGMGSKTVMLHGDAAPKPPKGDGTSERFRGQPVAIDPRLVEARDAQAAAEAETHVGRTRGAAVAIDSRLVEARDRQAVEEAKVRSLLATPSVRSRRY